jgi:hypothetical protein
MITLVTRGTFDMPLAIHLTYLPDERGIDSLGGFPVSCVL